MGNKKTNVDYLREIIEKNMPEGCRDEAIEFLDGIDNDMDILKREKSDLQNDLSAAKRDLQEIEDEETENRNDRFTFGHWDSDSLPIMSLMGTLGEEINNTSPWELERRLKG